MRALIILSIVMFPMSLPAQMGSGRASTIYDVKTEQTAEGKVLSVKTIPSRRGGGVHVQLQTAEGTLEVRLGPAWFLEEKGLKVAAGDTLKVTGSKIQSGSGAYLLAREVKAGERTTTLRDAQGLPAWRRGRRP